MLQCHTPQEQIAVCHWNKDIICAGTHLCIFHIFYCSVKSYILGRCLHKTFFAKQMPSLFQIYLKEHLNSPFPLGYFWVGVTHLVGTSQFARCNLCEWGGCCAPWFSWGTCQTVHQPHPAAHCEETLQGRPSCNLGCGIWKTNYRISHSSVAGSAVWFRIWVICYTSITATQDPSC